MATDLTAMLSIAQRADLLRRGPSPRARLLLYGAAWLPPLVMLFVLFPPIDPVLRRRIEQEEVPKVVRSLGTFIRLNEASHYLLSALALVALLLVDEAVLRVMSRLPVRRRWSWLWVGAVAAVGLSGWVILWRGLALL